jgi:uncharacterized protein YndB with AHSA1/START domain
MSGSGSARGTTIPAVVIEVCGETTILRPIEDVFDFLADPRNEPKWLPALAR